MGTSLTSVSNNLTAHVYRLFKLVIFDAEQNDSAVK